MPNVIINREVYDDVIINTRFEESKTRTNLTSGENLAISLGKVKKYLNDLGDAAFVDIDTELDDTSTNPVQNKVIASALDDKANLDILTPISETDYNNLTVKDKPVYFIYD